MRAVSKSRQKGTAATGVGLGLRFDFLEDVAAWVDESGRAKDIPFFEIAPENHMRRGGHLVEAVEHIADHVPIITHGLALSLGGLDPYDPVFMGQLETFLNHFEASFHSDHLCFSGAEGRALHDLLPMPFTRAAAQHMATRIVEAQDQLGVAMAVENISYYAELGSPEMSEVQFLMEVLERADCKLLLDVNNVYVNGLNFGFDPLDWLAQVDMSRVIQMHVAGHEFREDDGLTIDTHGAEVIPQVEDLLEWAVARTGPVPVVLERDNKLPPLASLMAERTRLQARYDSGMRAFSEASR